MEWEHIVSDNEDKIVAALNASDTSLTYAQLVQVTGLSMPTVRRLTKKLRTRRLIKGFTDGKTRHFKPADRHELPRVLDIPVEDYLTRDNDTAVVAQAYYDFLQTVVALIYIKPAWLKSGGKTEKLSIAIQRNSKLATEYAQLFDKLAGESRYIFHTLARSNEYDFDKWASHKDYDPTTAIEILKKTTTKNTFEPGVLDELLKRWAEKKVG